MADRVSNEELWKRIADELAKPVLDALDHSSNRDDASVILRQFLDQVLNSASVIAHLSQSYEGEWGTAGAVLLRRAYDISFQAMYLIKDPDDAVERAKDHRDYFWIEKIRSIRDMDDAALMGSAAAISAAESPRRDRAEADFRDKYKQAIKRQKDRRGPKWKEGGNWYVSNLRELASQFGILSEYLTIVRDLHKITHNAPSVLSGAAMSNPQNLPAWTIAVAIRVMKCNLDYHCLSLGDDIDDCFKNAFEDITLRFG